MLTALRKGANMWFVRIILVLIIASFMVWGVESVHLTGPANVASVDNINVTQAEYSRAFRTELIQRTPDPSEPYTAPQAIADGLDRLVLERLVMGAALDNAAEDLGLRASDHRIAAAIHEAPRFQGPSGAFDMAIYRQELSQRGMTEYGFEQETRRLMERADLIGTLRSGVVVPEAIVQAIYAHASEVRWGHYVGIPSAGMTGVPEPSDTDVKAYYDAHQQRYSEPEYRAFRFVVLNQAALAANTQIADDVLRKEFEARKDTVSTPEKRDLKQIIVADEAAAKALKQRLDAGEDFVEVARSAGMSAGEVALPGTERSKLGYLGDEAADKAFSLEQGKVSDPVDSKLGWAIFKVDAVTPGREVTFDEARPQIMKDLVDRQVSAAMDELSEKARTQIAEGAAIEAVSQSLGLPLRSVAQMNRDGKDATGEPVTGLPPGKAFIPSLFGKTQGEFIDLEDDGENGYFVTHLDKIIPARVKPLSEIRDQVRADWTRDARDKAARAVAQKVVEKVRGGTSLSDAAREIGAVVASTPMVSRSQAPRLGEYFSPELVTAMFDADKDGVVYGASARNDGYFVVRVADVKPMPIDPNSADYGQIRDALSETLKLDIFAQYQTYLFDKYSVTRNQKLVDQITSQQQ